jgi:hypothetical protein
MLGIRHKLEPKQTQIQCQVCDIPSHFAIIQGKIGHDQ